MEVSGIDHVVLTVSNIDETANSYQKILGMDRVVLGDGQVALKFGVQKINLHQAGREPESRTKQPAVGFADFCFLTPVDLDDAMSHVRRCGVEIIPEPVARTGAKRNILSFYFSDPSGKLIEVANETSSRGGRPLANTRPAGPRQKNGAGDGIRTRDPQLGRLML